MSNETKSGTPKLNEALKKAQEEMIHPKRTKTNPHFGSKYADLDDCWEAWMKVGPKNGLTVSQGGGVGAPPAGRGPKASARFPTPASRR